MKKWGRKPKHSDSELLMMGGEKSKQYKDPFSTDLELRIRFYSKKSIRKIQQEDAHIIWEMHCVKFYWVVKKITAISSAF